MEVQRLAVSLRTVHEELKAEKVVERLSALAEAASVAAQNPADAAATATFLDKAREMQEVLRNAETQYLGPSARRVLRKTGFEELLAPELLAKLDEILNATPFLLAQASEQLKKLAKTTKEKLDQITALLNTLGKLPGGTGPAQSAPHELGVLLPGTVVRSDLREVNRQLDEWIYVIDTIVELTEGQPDSEIPLTAASAGTFEFFVKLDPQGALAFLILVGGVVKIFTSVLKSKNQRDAMSDYPQSVLDGMKKYEDELVEKAKLQIRDELMKSTSKSIDGPRRNELKTALKHCIDWVLKSMNVGVDVEVNSHPTDEEGAKTDERVKELQQRVETLILDVNRSVLSLPPRDTPLLQLPPPEPDAKELGKDKSKTKPARGRSKTAKGDEKPNDAASPGTAGSTGKQG